MSAKAAALPGTGTISVLTLNIWGLWLVSKRRAERVRHLASYLSTCHEDVVLLQEVWVDSDAQQLISAARNAGLVHATHFRSGVFGSGLVTLSRHPIIRHAFWRYAAGGFATAITCGDYYAGKGVGWVRLSTPLGEVDVFNTHLHANYCHDYRIPPADIRRAAAAAAAQLVKGGSGTEASKAAAEAMLRGSGAPEWLGSRIPDDDDAGVRICQLLELSEVIGIISGCGNSSSSGRRMIESSSRSSSSSRLLILGGDLNCKPHTVEIDLLRLRLPQLSDAWSAAATRSSNGSLGSSDENAALLARNPEGYTCHAPGNSFQPRRQVPERIDYVWSNMVTLRSEVTLQMCPSTSPSSQGYSKSKRQAVLSYSDHFAVRAVLARESIPTASPSRTSPDRAMKLTAGATAAVKYASVPQEPAQQQQQRAVIGEGAAMPITKQVATAYAARLLLEEGYEAFINNGRAMLALGGFLLASVIYVGVGGPLLWPDVCLSSLAITVAVMTAACISMTGLVLLLMGHVGDKSQQRAMQSGLRLLHVWMEQQGLSALPRQLLVQHQQDFLQ